ncbi:MULTISPECIES: hypothetical protein [Streptomyces]|uniref:Uncharacterized protein n=1 Tax=Streptomyces evansiae TaxID=3075535 RepID=A0ABU2RAH4_9ACTN|nr:MULTISPECIES: hypothetical protein [unclassified Streptomyces]MDT0413281.1 hypothetical protein [Streptomyces sp. DSM 41979]MYQ57427.1 hypothetical protein [Streptomyces sp. SID4926]SCE58829.1 hypothetical protein GA0115252_17343 [Streptomyces sp. DfronAA-171]
MHPYRHALLSALDALDAAFAAEPALPVTGCAYRWGEEHFAELSGPLDALSEETILGVAMEVSDHWNDFPRLYRRLTPLLVRRAVLGGEHGVPADVVASRLREAGCLESAQGLTDALRAVGAAWWRAVLHGEVRGAGGNPDAGEALGVLTVASGTVRPWLGIWAATRTPYADALLAEYIAQLPYSVGISATAGGTTIRVTTRDARSRPGCSATCGTGWTASRPTTSWRSTRCAARSEAAGPRGAGGRGLREPRRPPLRAP